MDAVKSGRKIRNKNHFRQTIASSMQRGAAFVFTVSMIDMQKPWASWLLIFDNEYPVQSYTSTFETTSIFEHFMLYVRYLQLISEWLV